MKIDTKEIIDKIKKLFEEIYSNTHKIEISLSNIKFKDGFSDPYYDGNDVVSTMVHASEMTINAKIETQFTSVEWAEYKSKIGEKGK